MQSPFDIYDIDTNKIIITTNKQIKIHQCEYMIVYSINLLEILTIILGGINNNGNIGLFYSNMNLQKWLIVSGIYSIIYMVLVYQFNQKKYTNKIYFILLDFIKFCWICIGFGILLGYNKIIGCNFIIAYSLFYIIFSFIFVLYTFFKTISLHQYNYSYL